MNNCTALKYTTRLQLEPSTETSSLEPSSLSPWWWCYKSNRWS